MQAPEKKTKNKQPVVRGLKIQSDVRDSGTDRIRIPVIRLSGIWLAELGFAPDMRVTITTMDKQIIIRLDEQ
jgi:hypothetical protein